MHGTTRWFGRTVVVLAVGSVLALAGCQSSSMSGDPVMSGDKGMMPTDSEMMKKAGR